MFPVDHSFTPGSGRAFCLDPGFGWRQAPLLPKSRTCVHLPSNSANG